MTERGNACNSGFIHKSVGRKKADEAGKGGGGALARLSNERADDIQVRKSKTK